MFHSLDISEEGGFALIYNKINYQKLPEKAGVYIYYDDKKQVIYVGKAINLRSRVSSYFAKNVKLGDKTRILVEKVNSIKIVIVESELEALLLESFYIKKFRPKYNIRLSDDKSYVQIGISIKNKYPVVSLVRRGQDKNSIFFGPYPNSTAVKIVLKTIRKIFPYVSVPNHPKRICLYNHLGLCPCPPIFDSIELKKEYGRNIRGIIRILEGESPKILKELEKQRSIYSDSEQYEQAQEINKKIQALKIITVPFHRPLEYDFNPNLRVDKRNKELNEFMQVLNAAYSSNNIDHSVQKLHRIECFDISNTQGTHATGSMVVFTDGEKDSSEYRRFKIKKGDTPNDFAMMQEVLKRRIEHFKDWGRPDLIIVDGGKGQVTSALKALGANNTDIPLIGLAKREETIVICNKFPINTNFKYPISNNSGIGNLGLEIRNLKFIEVSLPKNSGALLLIMRIRDEAHRFAITYHRLLRSKANF